jgi:hypothetical protein
MRYRIILNAKCGCDTCKGHKQYQLLTERIVERTLELNFKRVKVLITFLIKNCTNKTNSEEWRRLGCYAVWLL